jgi:hypothetical protein
MLPQTPEIPAQDFEVLLREALHWAKPMLTSREKSDTKATFGFLPCVRRPLVQKLVNFTPSMHVHVASFWSSPNTLTKPAGIRTPSQCRPFSLGKVRHLIASVLGRLAWMIALAVCSVASAAPLAFKPTSPIPANNATHQSPGPTVLSWANGGGAVSYDAYFGSTPTLGVTEFNRHTTSAFFTAPAVDAGVTYYWRIDAYNSDGTVTTGNTWQFTTFTRIIGLAGNMAFGNLPIGATGQRTLIINNTGDSVLQVNEVTYPTGFSGNWPGGTIAAGGHHDVTVTFSPSSPIDYNGTIALVSDKTSGIETINASGTGTALGTVQAPAISPNGGNFINAVVVTLASQTPGATIYYTTDGNDPTPSSKVYISGFTLTNSTTLKARAFKSGWVDSQTAAAIFTITQSDTQGPAVAIGFPTNNAVVTSMNLTVTGTASDNGFGNNGVSSVKVNGVNATGGVTGGVGTANWSASITLVPGVNTITAVARDSFNNVRQNQITVTYNSPSYLVTPSAGPNGSITPVSPQSVSSGGNLPFEAFPNAGYVVEQWFVNGEVKRTGGNTFTLSNVTSAQIVQVTFKIAPTLQVNLTPYQPSGWSDKIVVAKSGNATVNNAHDGVSLHSSDTLYVCWAQQNSGTDTMAEGFNTELLVDGVSQQIWYTGPGFGAGAWNFILNYSLGYLAAGNHTITLRVDSMGTFDEANESDNEYTRYFVVGPAQAVFVPGSAGYTGILNGDFISHGYGKISVQTTASGKITGKMLVDGVTFPFSGKLSLTGEFTKSLRARSGGAVEGGTLAVTVHTDGGLSGSWEKQGGVTYSISGERNATGTTTYPLAQKARYTAHLRGEDITPTGGSVRGYVLATVGASGAATFVGSLPDGTKLTGSSRVSITGRLPLVFGLYQARRGYLFGVAAITGTGSGRLLGGSLRWSKPAQFQGLYPDGLFDAVVELAGHDWVPTASGARLVPDFDAVAGNMLVRFSSGELSTDLVKVTNLNIRNLVVSRIMTPEKLKLTIFKGSGLFSGTFRHTDGKTRTIRGAFVQNPGGLSIAEGYFPGVTVPGLVTITAPSP